MCWNFVKSLRKVKANAVEGGAGQQSMLHLQGALPKQVFAPKHLAKTINGSGGPVLLPSHDLPHTERSPGAVNHAHDGDWPKRLRRKTLALAEHRNESHRKALWPLPFLLNPAQHLRKSVQKCQG